MRKEDDQITVPEQRTDELIHVVYHTSPYVAEERKRRRPKQICIGFVCEGGSLDPRASLAAAIFRKIVAESWGENIPHS
jgi:hypothetical protein